MKPACCEGDDGGGDDDGKIEFGSTKCEFVNVKPACCDLQIIYVGSTKLAFNVDDGSKCDCENVNL